MTIIIILASLIFGAVGIGMAQQKGIHPLMGFIAGALLGPLVFLIGFVKVEKRKCPHCAELVKLSARICPHCQQKMYRSVLIG